MSTVPADKEAPRDTSALSLVVVDDDRYIVSLLEDVFHQEGLEVTAFTSSVEAREHLGQSAPDVLITDIKMPEITGLDLLREVRGQNPETLVIIITGYASLQTTLEAVELGAFDYITKPFLLGEVKLVVQRAIEQIQLRGENERLLGRVSELEKEFHRLQGSFENLSREYSDLSEQLQSRATLGDAARQMVVPQVAQVAIRPYEAQAKSTESRLSAHLALLSELHERGILRTEDFETVKRRLAEATGQR